MSKRNGIGCLGWIRFILSIIIIIMWVSYWTSSSATPHDSSVTPTPQMEFDTIYWGRMGFYWARSHSPKSINYFGFDDGTKTLEFAQANYSGDSEVWFTCDEPHTVSTDLTLSKISPLIEGCESGYMSIRTR